MTKINDTIAQPFVGVCGVQSTDELVELEQYAKKYLGGTGRYIMAGVKNIQSDIQNAHQSEIVRSFVHCDFSDTEPFEQIVERNLRAGQHFVRGLQLNLLLWLEVDYAPLWKRLKHLYPDLLLILQVPKSMMERYSSQQVADRLRGLCIDYVLFDPSQSRGKMYCLEDMRQYVDTVYQQHRSLGIVVAGGLESSTIPALFQPLEECSPGLSCDAFYRLQDQQAQRLSWSAVDAYLAAWRDAVVTSYVKSAIFNELGLKASRV